MSNVDLNLNNYNFNDILSLFKLSHDYDFNDLKSAFITYVAPLHPDKSKLPSDYFIFYKKAYGVLLNIYKLNKKHNNANERIQVNYLQMYNDTYADMKRENEENITYVKPLLKSKQFNEEFNKIFEENVKQFTDNDGYEEWFRSNDDNDINQDKGKMSMSDFKNEFERKKYNIISKSEISQYNGYDFNSSLSSISASSLINNNVSDYSSTTSSGLAYKDLKQAHTNTIINVDVERMSDRFMTSNDYEKYKYFRNSENISPISREESEKLLKQQYKNEEEVTIRNTFELLKQDEEQKNIMNKVWSKLKHLTYK